MGYDTWRRLIFREIHKNSKHTKIMADRRTNQFYSTLKSSQLFSNQKTLAYIFDLFKKLLKKYSNFRLKEVQNDLENSFQAVGELVEKNDTKV